MNPNDKIIVPQIGGPAQIGSQTNAEVHLSGATPEVLRDLARNECAGREWRKAAVERLLAAKHPFAQHSDFRELKSEIEKENDARDEVENLIAQVAPAPEVRKMEFVPDKYVSLDLSEAQGDDVEDYAGPLKASVTTKTL